MTGASVDGVIVVVPVHDEQRRLARCLKSVHDALAHRSLRGLVTRVVVVLDSCTDDSASIAEAKRRPADLVGHVDVRNVGRARAAGSGWGLDDTGIDPQRVWIAHTDADTVVPPHWILRQLAAATTAQAVAGVVRVEEWSTHTAETRRQFRRHYRSWPFRPHPHVHGANLGVRGSAYLDVGGFPPLRCGEDHALWDALGSVGHEVTSTRRVWVTTSARRDARAGGGFADTLLEIEATGTAAAGHRQG